MQQTISGTQNVYGKNGDIIFNGEWDSKKLCEVITAGNPSYWKGRRTLDLGANTAGLSLELARMGAEITASEPDPYKNSKTHTIEILKEIIKQEELNLDFSDKDLFNAHLLGSHDTVLCLGLIYHFRDPQYVLDYLSELDHKELIISTQLYPGSGLCMYNRKDPNVIGRANFWDNHTDSLSGWHPTRELFKAMLVSAGYTDIQSLTGDDISFLNKPKNLTNSAYFKAIKNKQESVDPIEARKIFYPR